MLLSTARSSPDDAEVLRLSRLYVEATATFLAREDALKRQLEVTTAAAAAAAAAASAAPARAESFERELAAARVATPAPESIAAGAFWEALLSARVGSDDVLRLPPGVFMLGVPELPAEIYVRPKVYALLFDHVLDLKKSGVKGLVLTGSPGIGKTCFLYYLLWRLALAMAAGEEGAPSLVVFEREVQEKDRHKARFLFRAGEPPRVGAWNAFQELEDPKCWCVAVGGFFTRPSFGPCGSHSIDRAHVFLLFCFTPVSQVLDGWPRGAPRKHQLE